MARYIDADLLKQCIQNNITRYFTYGAGGYFLAEDVVEDIDAFPTADVVPRADYDAVIAAQESLQRYIRQLTKEIKELKNKKRRKKK